MGEINTTHQTNPQITFSWKSPLRAYKKKSAGVLRFYIALSLLLSLIVFFFGEKILVLPIWAVMFLFYVLTITPPPEVENRITKFCIETSGNTYRFDTLSHFYFIHKYDYTVMVVVGRPPQMTHIYLVVSDSQIKNNLIKILSEHLIYQEHPTKTLVDKLTELLTSLMPDEEEGSKAVFEKGQPATL